MSFNILSSEGSSGSPEKMNEILGERLERALAQFRVQTGMLQGGVVAVVSFILANSHSGYQDRVDVSILTNGNVQVRWPDTTEWGRVSEGQKALFEPRFVVAALAARREQRRQALVAAAEGPVFKDHSVGVTTVGRRVTVIKGKIRFDHGVLPEDEESVVREILVRRGLV